ncbi:hypothetical protein [Limosilactobacillus allomucosae]|uniref:YtxH domain-containing protein n=1 Tax=Limosilactobacillus allomucosae TaxID=3142938 RepID=A0ABV0I3I8_9LACO
MTKKVLAGFLVGGAAAFGAWQALSADKKKQIKQAVADKTHDAVDYATDYAINALDLADGMVQDVKEQAVDKFGDRFSDLADSVKKGADTVKKSADTVKKSADQAVNHFTNDDFDEQTAQIREELAKAQSDNSSQDDIVIDKTTDASEENNDADASQDDHSSSSDQD